jgi:hypothetical protein
MPLLYSQERDVKRRHRIVGQNNRHFHQSDSAAVTATRGESPHRVLRHHVVFALIIIPLLAAIIFGFS